MGKGNTLDIREQNTMTCRSFCSGRAGSLSMNMINTSDAS